MSDGVSFVQGFALFSSILLVSLPLLITAFGMTPPVNELQGFAGAASTVVDTIISLFEFSFRFGFVIIKYVALGILYIADGLTLDFILQVDIAIEAVSDVFGDIDTTLVNLATSFRDFMLDIISAYSLIPMPMLLIVLIPNVIALIYLFSVRGG